MGFGVKLDVKVEAPKIEVPKVDAAAAVSSVTGAVSGAVDSAKGAVAGAVDSAKGAVESAVSAATEAANSVVSVATKAVASLTTVAGAIADVAVSFTGAIDDIALEPHLSLDANASFGKTKFEKGPISVVVDMTSAEADKASDMLHIFTTSGEYAEYAKICDNYEVEDYSSGEEDENAKREIVFVKFENAPMDGFFSLEIIPENGDPYLIFRDVTYGLLRKDSSKMQRLDSA